MRRVADIPAIAGLGMELLTELALSVTLPRDERLEQAVNLFAINVPTGFQSAGSRHRVTSAPRRSGGFSGRSSAGRRRPISVTSGCRPRAGCWPIRQCRSSTLPRRSVFRMSFPFRANSARPRVFRRVNSAAGCPKRGRNGIRMIDSDKFLIDYAMNSENRPFRYPVFFCII